VTTANDASDAANVKAEVVDGTPIHFNALGTAAAKRNEEQQPPYKSSGMDNINNDAEDKLSPSSFSSTSKLNDVQPVQVISQQMDNLQEDECRKPTVPKRDKSKQRSCKDFFSRVDELRVYKEKHGHLNVRKKENESLYDFSKNLRGTRRAINSGNGKIHYSLDDSRIAALDAIGFDWKLGAGALAAETSKNDVAEVIRRSWRIQSQSDDEASVTPSSSTKEATTSTTRPRRATKDSSGKKAASTAKGKKELMNEVQHVQQNRPIIQQMDYLQEDECRKPTVPKLDKSKQKDFFSRVDKLRAYKEKHGHLNVQKKENESLYGFCGKLRRSRTAIITGKGTTQSKLTKKRIAALDAIGFDWKPGTSSTAATTDDTFLARVDELRVYKEKHGHLNVRQNEDLSLCNFCYTVRSARRFLITGKGAHYMLNGDRIAALDAIGFDWNPGASINAASKDDKFFARVDELKAYKEKHGHVNVAYKEVVSRGLYNFCNHVRQSQLAIISGKGKVTHRLDETRIAALDAIGFNWNSSELTTSPSDVMSKSAQQATNPKINIGDVGYQFLKQFDSGWFHGTVVEILQDADDGWDRRCVYEDGDCEDLTLNELKRLATLSPQEHV
jgi:hypothetical protein